MASRPRPGPPVLAALLLALALSGCTRDETSPPVGTAAATDPPRLGDSDTTVVDRVERTAPVDAGPHGRVDEIAVDSRGRPVVLIVDERGAMSVDRPGAGDGGGRRRPVDPLFGRVRFATMAVTPDDDVLVTGYEGDRFVVASLGTDGDVRMTPIAADLSPGQANEVTAGLAPDGSALYVTYVDNEETPQMLAADPATGEVLHRTTVGSSLGDPVTPTQIVVSASGERVFVALDVDAGDGRTATLRRLGGNLEWLGEVPLVHGQEPSRTAQVVTGQDGTAYATLVVGHAGTPDVEVRLVAVPPGSLSATQVAVFPDQDDVSALAVDPSGDWAYIGGLAQPSNPLGVTVTPLDLLKGEPRSPVQLCARGELSGIVLAEDSDQAWIAGRCSDKRFATELWTLR